MRSAATTIAAVPPFMSLVPRPYMRPSSISAANASRDQSALPSGTVSRCPVRHSAGRSPRLRVRAIRLVRPGASSCEVTSRPAASSRAASSDAAFSSSPGGLTVRVRMSSCVSSTTRRH